MKYIEKLKEYPEDFDYCLGASSDEIHFAEQQLGMFFPKAYKKFLSECGLCSFGDTRIDGIYKTEKSIDYSIVENTLNIRKLGNLDPKFIVLDFEESEWLVLYEVSGTDEVENSCVYGVEVSYDENEKMVIGNIDKKSKRFNSFEEYFENFLELRNFD